MCHPYYFQLLVACSSSLQFTSNILWSLSSRVLSFTRTGHFKVTRGFFSQPSIYRPIDGWLYGMSMTSVVCNAPVSVTFRYCLKTIPHHSVFTTWKWHPFATWTPSFIILVWGHHPLIGAKHLPASRTVLRISNSHCKLLVAAGCAVWSGH